MKSWAQTEIKFTGISPIFKFKTSNAQEQDEEELVGQAVHVKNNLGILINHKCSRNWLYNVAVKNTFSYITRSLSRSQKYWFQYIFVLVWEQILHIGLFKQILTKLRAFRQRQTEP